MKQYGALLHSEWRAGVKHNEIVGNWDEYFSPYEVDVPCQLRDLLIEMQNTLARKYRELGECEAALRKCEQECASMFPSQDK